MTKKDYTLIAKCIREFVIAHDKSDSNDARGTVRAIARALEQDNNNFDYRTFISECGIID